MQTLTKLIMDNPLKNQILSEFQLARLLGGSPQRRYNLVNRATKAGELHNLRRGLYVLPQKYRDNALHPYAVAQRLTPGSYVSLETALSYHGWIPEAVHTIVSVVPGAKSSELSDERLGRFTFHPLSIKQGHFLEMVSRLTISQQTFLVADPLRALMDLVCRRKLEWQNLDWFEQSMRIEPDRLYNITNSQIQTLHQVYKQHRMQGFLTSFSNALALKSGAKE